jgi:hypothetical protein
VSAFALVPSAQSRARHKSRTRSSAPRLDGDLLDLYVLADRAQLWASIAPGLGHHLANVLMSLSATRHELEAVECLQNRLERAHHVLAGMSEKGSRPWPVSIATVLADVDAWHRLQLSLPRAELRLDVAPGLGVVDGGTTRLHHAVLALVTLAKECGAEALTLRARGDAERAWIELDVPGTICNDESSAVERRLAVVEHLMETLGGRMEWDADGVEDRVRLDLRIWPAPSR